MTLEIISEINYLAVLVVAIVGTALGALWYGPLFGKKWIGLMGWTEEQVARMKAQGMARSYVLNFIATLVMSWVLAYFVLIIGAVSLTSGAGVGLMIWLGFVVTIMLGSVLWEGRKTELYVLNILYWLMMLIVMGGILAIWP